MLSLLKPLNPIPFHRQQFAMTEPDDPIYFYNGMGANLQSELERRCIRLNHLEAMPNGDWLCSLESIANHTIQRTFQYWMEQDERMYLVRNALTGTVEQRFSIIPQRWTDSDTIRFYEVF